MKYVTLASPVVLSSNTTYFIVSQETSGGDYWYDLDTVLSTGSPAAVQGPAWAFNSSTNFTVYSGSTQSYVPVSFKYAGGWQQTNEVHYVYDGNLVAQERDAFNIPQVSYTRGNDLTGSLQRAGGIGGLLARTDNSKLITQKSADAHA